MNICPIPYITPEPVYHRIQLGRFVGRTWLIAQFDQFVQQHDRGYFLLEAEAGLGKTTFLAHLVQQRDYIHLFIEQARGLDNMAKGIRSLATQIVRTWHLYPWFADDILPGVAVRPGFLAGLLSVAARQRDQYSPQTPIILAIDGLESAGTFPGQNTLGLPDHLPRGVYILLTHRPAPFTLQTTAPQQHVTLHASQPENVQDIQHYLQHAVSRPSLHNLLQTDGCPPDHCITILQERCQGNWSYLFYLMQDIERDNLPATTSTSRLLPALPHGLWSYLAGWWQAQRQTSRATWHTCLLPLLGTLAGLMESLPLQMLLALTGLHNQPDCSPHHIEHLLQTVWRPFLIIEGTHEPCYCLGDTALRSMLTGDASWQSLTPVEQALTNELIAATRLAHDRIASRYLLAWGGLEHQLPGLARPELRDKDQGYGLRHLVAHLEQAGRSADIHRLLQMEQTVSEHTLDRLSVLFTWIDHALQGWQGNTETVSHHALVWYTAREDEGDLADYLSDLQSAWHLAEQQGEQPRQPHSLLALQCRYALMIASMNSLSHDIPVSLLKAMLTRQSWNPAQVLVYIRQMSDEARQATALASLATCFPASMLENVLSIALSLHDEQHRAHALAGLAPHLPHTLYQRMLKAARSITNPAWRINILVALLPLVAETERTALLQEALEATQKVWNASVRVDSLKTLAPYLPEPMLPTALDIAQSLVDTDWRCRALIGMAPVLPQPLLRNALHMWKSWSGSWRSRVLAELAPRLTELGEMDHAFDMVAHLPTEQQRAIALAGLAPYLSVHQIHTAMTIVQAFTHPQEQARTLVALAPYLTRKTHREALELALALQDMQSQIMIVLALMPHIPDQNHAELINTLLEHIRAIENDQQRSNLLADLACRLAEQAYIQEALTAIQMIEGTQQQAAAMVQLAPALPEPLMQKTLDTIATIEQSEQRNRMLDQLAPHLPESLLPRALTIARSIGDGNQRTLLLAHLAAHLPRPLLHQIVDMAKASRSEQHTIEVLGVLAPHLPEQLMREALTIVRSLKREDYRVQALERLTPSMPRQLVRVALDITSKLHTIQNRATALVALAPYVPEAMQREALTTIHAIETETQRTRALQTLIPHLHQSLLFKALAEVRTLNQRDNRDRILMLLAPRLATHSHWKQALDAAWSIGNAEKRITTLVQLAPFLTHPLLQDILATIHTLEHADVRAKALADISVYLPAQEADVLVPAILHSASQAKWQQAATPATILPRLPQADAPRRIIASLQALENALDRARGFAELLPLLEPALQQQALQHMLHAVQQTWGQYRANVLVDIAPYLAESTLRRALAAAQEIDQPAWRSRALTGLIPFLPPALKAEVIEEPLAATRTIWETTEYVRVLDHLLPHLPEPRQPQVLAEALHRARSLENKQERAAALHLLAPHLASLPADLRASLWSDTLHILANRTRPHLLSDIQALAPLLSALGNDATVAELAQAVIEVGHWFA